jgi:hypothetical protein
MIQIMTWTAREQAKASQGQNKAQLQMVEVVLYSVLEMP